MKRQRESTHDDDDYEYSYDYDDHGTNGRPGPSIGPPHTSTYHINSETPNSSDPNSNNTNHQIPPLTDPNSNSNNNNDSNNIVKGNAGAEGATSTGIGSGNNSNNGNNNKEQDRFLPIANVGRIMKKVIPGNGKISKDAKETVQECVSEFISFVTGEASDKCQREKRKTINGDDILWAIMTLGFEDYVTPLKLYLTKYRDIEGEKLNVPKQQQQQQQHHQQRMEHHIQHEHNVNMHYSSMYPTPNLIPQPSFVSTDPPFQLPFSQNSIQPMTLPQHTPSMPQQEHVDDPW